MIFVEMGVPADNLDSPHEFHKWKTGETSAAEFCYCTK